MDKKWVLVAFLSEDGQFRLKQYTTWYEAREQMVQSVYEYTISESGYCKEFVDDSTLFRDSRGNLIAQLWLNDAILYCDKGRLDIHIHELE